MVVKAFNFSFVGQNSKHDIGMKSLSTSQNVQFKPELWVEVAFSVLIKQCLGNANKHFNFTYI